METAVIVNILPPNFRSCERDLLSCLGGPAEAQVAFAAGGGARAAGRTASPLGDLRGIRVGGASNAAHSSSTFGILNSALFARTLDNVQVQLNRGFKSRRYQVKKRVIRNIPL